MNGTEWKDLKSGDKVRWNGDDENGMTGTVQDRGTGRVIVRWDDGMFASIYLTPDDEAFKAVQVIS